VTGVSRHILQKHLEMGLFRNAEIKKCIYNPIDQASQAEIRNVGKSRKGNELTFGYVGRLSPTKGIEFVLKNFKKHIRDAKLHIYGESHEPSYGDYLRNSFASERIIFKGFVDPNKIYPEIDVLLFSSIWHEPFARVIVEASSHGVPVVASSVGGVTETVVEGKNGLLYRHDDDKSFIDKIHFLIRDPKKLESLSKNSSENAQQYGCGEITSQYAQTYREILKEYG